MSLLKKCQMLRTGTFLAAVLVFAACSYGPANKNTADGEFVSLSPSITEIIYELGEGDKIAAVTEFCSWPPAAQNKVKAGTLLNVNMELIKRINPRIVFISNIATGQNVISELEKFNLNYEIIATNSVYDIPQNVIDISKKLGVEKKGEALAARLKENLKKQEVKNPPSVLFVVGHNPLVVAGKNNFLNDAIKNAGGINLGESLGDKYIKINIETFYKLNPDVILEGYMINKNPEEQKQNSLSFYGTNLSLVNAYKTDSIYFLDADIMFRPTPRFINEGINQIKQIIKNYRGE